MTVTASTACHTVLRLISSIVYRKARRNRNILEKVRILFSFIGILPTWRSKKYFGCVVTARRVCRVNKEKSASKFWRRSQSRAATHQLAKQPQLLHHACATRQRGSSLAQEPSSKLRLRLQQHSHRISTVKKSKGVESCPAHTRDSSGTGRRQSHAVELQSLGTRC